MADKALQAGDLDQRIDFLSKGTHLNTLGEIEATSFGLTIPQVWAKVEDKSGDEKPEADRETASVKTVFTIRHRSDLSESMRILYNRREYDIESILNGPGRKQWLIITGVKAN